MYSAKINQINEYIARADAIIMQGNVNAANELCDEIIAAFANEIDNITCQLTAYEAYEVDYIKDLKLLKVKLGNHLTNIESGFHAVLFQRDHLPGVNQIVQLNQSIDINVSFDNTVATIDEMPDELLSANDKDILQGKLSAINVAQKNGKDKAEVWTKIKAVLAFLADKGADAAIASLPYLVSVLQSLK